jgi:CubicO group peptidase (beta-lactamase class C family)
VPQLSRRDFGLLAVPLVLGRPRRAAAAMRTWRVTGHALPGLAEFDTVMKAFMVTRSVPCGALAVIGHGRLLLARGYTWSAEATPVTLPTSLFRIASISKPITAAAVLRLAQDGRVALTDRVAGLLGLETAGDPRIQDVTVLRLLQHLGGWDREVSGDPLFDDPAVARALGKRLPVDRADIVAYVTARRLDHAPGAAYAYSNYGYLLLGRLIERVTGTPYADHVRRTVLEPLAIRRMRMGRTLVRAAGEMPYYSQYTGTTVMDPSGAQVTGPYGSFNHENNAFNGGWLASAVDLARFAAVYDGGTPVLGPQTAARAFALPETGAGKNGRYYGCGWHVRPGRGAFHTGSLPGTYALLVHRGDGLTWAAMFDQRDDPSGERYPEIDADLHGVADDVERWPAGDLTGEYF